MCVIHWKMDNFHLRVRICRHAVTKQRPRVVSLELIEVEPDIHVISTFMMLIMKPSGTTSMN